MKRGGERTEHKRERLGLCNRCGKNPKEKGKRCWECVRKANKKKEERKQRNREHGICVYCSHKARSNKVVCCECHLKRVFYSLNLLPEEEIKAAEAFRNFDGKCQCCGTTDSRGKEFDIDHDHKTRKFRGIICRYCNILLGFARDDVKRLSYAWQYLTGINVYECIRMLMWQVKEEQRSREVLSKALAAESSVPVPVPTTEEVQDRIEEILEVIRTKDLTEHTKGSKM